MHISAVALFDSGALVDGTGRLKVSRIRKQVASRIDRVPELSRRLAWVPFEKYPVWIDAQPELKRHVRRRKLRAPGDDRMLSALVAQIVSRPLDRAHPLWELWIVEGLRRGDRFALILKVHHALADGKTAIRVLDDLMTPPAADGRKSTMPWQPRAAPTAVQLLGAEIVRRLKEPLTIAGEALGVLGRPLESGARIAADIASAAQLVWAGLGRVAPTFCNLRIGRRRDVCRFQTPLAPIHLIRRRHGATVNDVILAVTLDALLRLHRHRKVSRVEPIRVAVPVAVPSTEDMAAAGNKVSIGFIEFTPEAGCPATRLESVAALTKLMLNDAAKLRGPHIFEFWLNRIAPALLGAGVRLASSLSPYNLLVSYVRARDDMHLLGAKLVELFPIVPLFQKQGLALGVVGYGDALYWGLVADPDVVPDLDVFGSLVQESLQDLLMSSAEAEASVR
jgi:WS/DGAT/MGAT family acyltransferase